RSSLHVPCRGENTRSKCPFKFDHNSYLEQGVKNDFLEAEISYGKVGRPERIYHGKQTYPEQR
ncbi:hypothetical protein ACUTGG_22505, partial [Klebsiella pneumoniae]